MGAVHRVWDSEVLSSGFRCAWLRSGEICPVVDTVRDGVSALPKRRVIESGGAIRGAFLAPASEITDLYDGAAGGARDRLVATARVGAARRAGDQRPDDKAAEQRGKDTGSYEHPTLAAHGRNERRLLPYPLSFEWHRR